MAETPKKSAAKKTAARKPAEPKPAAKKTATAKKTAGAKDAAPFRKRRTQAESAGTTVAADAASLAEYQSMRDFGVTPEPGGKQRDGDPDIPIFVIQLHHATAKHYDFRLEMGGVLKSWAVPKGPSYNPADKRLAMMTEDHPIEYASFEGRIPEGHYGAGPVVLWDRGTVVYLPDEKTGEANPLKNLGKGKLVFQLDGEKLKGEWTLVKTRFGGKDNAWLLIKHRDVTASDSRDIVAEFPESVLSGKVISDF